MYKYLSIPLHTILTCKSMHIYLPHSVYVMVSDFKRDSNFEILPNQPLFELWDWWYELCFFYIYINVSMLLLMHLLFVIFVSCFDWVFFDNVIQIILVKNWLEAKFQESSIALNTLKYYMKSIVLPWQVFIVMNYTFTDTFW